MSEVLRMNAQSGADFLENVADGFTAVLSKGMEDLGGPWLARRAAGPVTWSDLGVMLLFLLLLLLLCFCFPYYFCYLLRIV